MTEPMAHTIYAILDDQDDVVHVSATSVPVQQMVGATFSHRFVQKGPLELWMRALDAPPRFVVLERDVPDAQRDLREGFWIACFTAVDRHEKLLNVAAFGCGRRGAPMDKKARALSAARTRATHAAEQRLATADETFPCREKNCGHVSPTLRGLSIHKTRIHW